MRNPAATPKIDVGRPIRLGLVFPRPGLCAALLVALLAVLWLAGGASRADVAGQFVVRSAAWLALIVFVIFEDRHDIRLPRKVTALFAAMVVLVAVQLVPLPPSIWMALPGRETFVDAARVAGEEQPWRSWSIVPGATFNALSSLIVPFVLLLLVDGLSERERRWLPGVFLFMVVMSTLLGLLQFSGMVFNNPFINDFGGVTGTFANRNHFALFIALGCVLLPAWVFAEGRAPRWRGPVALGLVILFTLMILASGSRAGMVLGIMALGLALALAWKGIGRQLRGAPVRLFPAVVVAIIVVIGIAVAFSIDAGRAVSIERILTADTGTDMRRRSLPTVLSIISRYFPFGSGLGGFDPIFRISEPFALLKPTYFNHAHNDFLEIVLDAGLPGALLLGAAVLWWGRATIAAWRTGSNTRSMLPRLGSAMLLLVFAASAIDYPARTPLMMAMIVVAALWLSNGTEHAARPALPGDKYHL